MENVTLNLLYGKLLDVQRDVKELRGSLVPVEQVSVKEHARLDAVFEEMRKGKATPWRDALKE
ncbi:MAG: hypothetical protein V1708_02025 [Candidatus Micrarchaeota archaeon]